jgi:hypothetical protein
MKSRPQWLVLIAFAAGLCGTVAALSQTIRIPDFRQSSSDISRLRPGEKCSECGRVISIREIRAEKQEVLPSTFQGSSRGPLDYNLVGAVVYLPLQGGASDRPFVGGVGTPEMKERFAQSTYEITLRLEDDTLKSFRRDDGTRFHVGDRVRVTGSGDIEIVAE